MDVDGGLSGVASVAAVVVKVVGVVAVFAVLDCSEVVIIDVVSCSVDDETVSVVEIIEEVDSSVDDTIASVVGVDFSVEDVLSLEVESSVVVSAGDTVLVGSVDDDMVVKIVGVVGLSVAVDCSEDVAVEDEIVSVEETVDDGIPSVVD